METGVPHTLLPPAWWHRLWFLVAFLLLLYVVLPHFADFSTSWHAISRASVSLVLIAEGLAFLTYCFAASVYVMLSVQGLKFWPTLLVQGSTAFTNRLLPAGLGGLTLYIAYLRKTRHSLAQSLAIVATNNALGLIAHGILLTFVLIVGRRSLAGHWHIAIPEQQWVYGVILVLLLAVVLLSMKKIRRWVSGTVSRSSNYILSYRSHPGRLVAGLMFAMLITLGYVGTLYACIHAVGLQQSFWEVFIVFTVGTIAGTAAPTPGGLGGLEAGVVASMVAYGSPAATALAAVLLYRLLTYWLLLLPGFIAFLIVRRRYWRTSW